jgi:F-type H+-transporting ATPase subunit b
VEQVFAAFGIDWRLLLVNLINFGLLLLALWYFLYAPLLRVLEARRQKVAEGVRAADDAKRALGEIESSRAHALAEAGREVDALLAGARASATQKSREEGERAAAAAAALLADAQAEAAEAKRRAVAESKAEVAKLIVLGMEKLKI